MVDWETTPHKVQGSEPWLKFRMGSIGASEAPAIMRVSPFMTPYQLWQMKRGIKLPQATNYIMERGHLLESIARRKYFLKRKIQVIPEVFEPIEKGSIFHASMDGWNSMLRVGAEIKCLGEKTHLIAKGGVVPAEYRPQLVQQFLVTKAVWIDYVSYYVAKGANSEEGDLAIVRVNNDEVMFHLIQEYVIEAHKFWKLVQTNQRPELMDRDFLLIEDARITTIGERLAIANDEQKLAKTKIEHLKMELRLIMDDSKWKRIECGKLKAAVSVRKGSIDWASVPHGLEKEALEEYRKPSTESFRVDIAK